MLSRTADHVYWMARYTERAENTARMLDVNWQMSLLPRPAEQAERSWRAMLDISELTEGYLQRHDRVSADGVLDFMVRDPANSSSIASCLERARENARAVRGSLTTEVWETQNATWLELRRLLAERLHARDPSQFFEWVKFRSHLARGVVLGTMLRDQALRFARIGTFLERADNTARLLAVKYYEDDGAPGQDEAHREFYRWTSILRSVSAFEIYRRVYRDVVTPERVAELLILRTDMPRSLAASLNALQANLEPVVVDRSGETMRLAGRLRSELHYALIDDILARGLQAYLDEFLERINAIGDRISRDFLLPLAA